MEKWLASLRLLCIAAVTLGAIGCDSKAVRTSVGLGRADAGRADGPRAVDPDRGACLAPGAPRVAPGQSCACDTDCTGGGCVQGVCCSGAACGAKRGLGEACKTADECDSAFCADGFCCNVACTGACVSCNQPEA